MVLASRRAVTVLFLALLSAAAPQRERSHKLNPPLLRAPVGNIEADFRFSADGARIVFREETGGPPPVKVELFSTNGVAPPVQLGPVGVSIDEFLIDPTGQRVVYRLNGDLYSVPITGGASVQLNPTLPSGGQIRSFQVTPDGTQVVFVADVITRQRFVLNSVPITGGPYHILISGLVAAGDVRDRFVLSSDSTHVVYLADQDVDEKNELYSARIGVGASSVKISGGLAVGGDVQSDFLVSADGTRVVYRADQLVNDQIELFSVPIDGSAASVRLNGPMAAAGDVPTAFQISPDSARVVFLAQIVAGVFEVDSAPIDGSAPAVRLCPALVGGQDVTTLSVSPDSARVVYRADQTVDELFELFGAPIDGSAPAVRLSGTLAADEDVLTDFRIAPAGGRVVFQTASAAASSARICTAPLDGSSAPLVLDSWLSPFDAAPEVGSNGVRVFYVKPVVGGLALMSARLDGSTTPLILGGGVRSLPAFHVRPDAAFVAYEADQAVLNNWELYLAPAGTPLASLKLSATSAPSREVGTVSAFTATRSHAIYTALQEDPNSSGLYSVLLSGGPSLRISGDLQPIEVLPAGKLAVGANERVVFQGSRRFGGSVLPDSLYSARIERHGEPLQLNANLVSGGSVIDYALDADGSRVVFRADQDQDETFELYRTAIDVAASPLKLSAPMVAGGDVSSGYVSTPGGRVLYVADQDVDETFELFGADGVSAPIKLSGALAPGGDVRPRIVLSTDGSHAFFRADKDVHGSVELYSVPTDGSASPISLSGPLGPGAAVQDDFQVTADGAFVVFRADLATVGHVDLYSAPSNGTVAPRLLSPGMIANGDVSEGFVLDPSGTYAVYRADAFFDERFKLFSVPIRTAGAPVRLDTTMYSVQPFSPPGTLTPGFQITPDGTHVLFLQDPSTHFELYSVPIGGGALLKLNAALSPSNFPGISGFSIDPRGENVVYLGDREDPELIKAFVVPVDRHREPLELSPPNNAWVRDDLVFAGGGDALVFRSRLPSLNNDDLYAAVLERGARPSAPPTPH